MISNAAGRYQLLARYYNAYKRLLRLQDFTPISQDKIAIQQVREQRAIADIRAGRFDDAVVKCQNIRASLPGWLRPARAQEGGPARAVREGRRHAGMSILDPRLRLALLLVLDVVSGAGYMKGTADGRAVERSAGQQEIDRWRANADAASTLYPEARDRKQIEYRIITKTVEAAKHAMPDLPDCRTGDDWMRIYRENAAIANGTDVSSGTGGADRPDVR